MIKKEVNEVFKQSLIFILVIVLIPFIIYLESVFSETHTPFLDIFFPVFQAGLLFFSLFMGISLFSFERRSRGIEYILSLPFSRLKLLYYKMVPRLSAVIGFYLLHILLYHAIGENRSFITYLSFSYIYFIVFVVSLYFSVSQDNFIISGIGGFFAFTFYMGIIYILYKVALLIRGGKTSTLKFQDVFMLQGGYGQPRLIFFTVLFILLPLVVSFVYAFKKFDIRPAKNFNKRYFKVFIPLFVVFLGLSFIFAYRGMHPGFNYYYLTQSHQLFEFSGDDNFVCKVYHNDKVRRLKEPLFLSWFPIEDNNFIYDPQYDEIVRLNLKNHEIESLYRVNPEKKLFWWLHRYRDNIAFFEGQRRKEKKDRKFFWNVHMVIIDINTKKIKKIKLSEPMRPNLHIFGVDEINGKRFWLLCPRWGKKYAVIQLWEDGQLTGLGESMKHPHYLNRMLVTNKKGALVFEKITEKGLELIRELPEGKDFVTPVWLKSNLDNVTLKEVYGSMQVGHKRRGIFRLDLETFQITEVEKKHKQVWYFFPNCFYAWGRDFDKENNSWIKNIYCLRNGKMTFLKEFKDVDPRFGTDFSSAGIVCRQKGKVRVYVFPDLRELTFKKLN